MADKRGAFVRLKEMHRDVSTYDFEFGEYKRTAPIKAVCVLEPFRVLYGDWYVNGAVGDYLCEEADGERRIVEAKTFEKAHEFIEEVAKEGE